MKLLHIIASPRGEKSRTLKISAELIDCLKQKYPNMVVEDLDLFQTKLPEVLGGAVDAKYASMANSSMAGFHSSWNEITTYAKEFLYADIYVISAPMWNFSIPYKLKHYIDIIMQNGFLFRFTENGIEGLAKNKKMYCITSRGNDYIKGTIMHQFDYQEPYLKTVFNLSGITDISFIHAQPLDFSPDITIACVEKAREEAKLMASRCEWVKEALPLSNIPNLESHLN